MAAAKLGQNHATSPRRTPNRTPFSPLCKPIAEPGVNGEDDCGWEENVAAREEFLGGKAPNINGGDNCMVEKDCGDVACRWRPGYKRGRGRPWMGIPSRAQGAQSIFHSTIS